MQWNLHSSLLGWIGRAWCCCSCEDQSPGRRCFSKLPAHNKPIKGARQSHQERKDIYLTWTYGEEKQIQWSSNASVPKSIFRFKLNRGLHSCAVLANLSVVLPSVDPSLFQGLVIVSPVRCSDKLSDPVKFLSGRQIPPLADSGLQPLSSL